MICPKCGNVITHNSYFDAYYCPRCGEFIREKPPMTNADRIRSMSDEELTKMLWKAGRNYRSICADPVVDYNEHYKHLIEWLQQPAEEDDHA